MKTVSFIFVLLLACISVEAQTSFRLVDGKVYNINDTTRWRKFGALEVVSVIPDCGIVCRCYHTQDDSYTSVNGNGWQARAGVTHRSHREYGEKILLINYAGYQSLASGMDISCPIFAMLVEPVALTPGPNSLTTYSGSYGHDTRTEEELRSYPTYNMGVDYYPPPVPLTPEQIKAREEKMKQVEINTVIWLKNQATNGMPDEQFELGQRYLIGKGVPKDTNSARMWLQKSADQGNSEASNLLFNLD